MAAVQDENRNARDAALRTQTTNKQTNREKIAAALVWRTKNMNESLLHARVMIKELRLQQTPFATI